MVHRFELPPSDLAARTPAVLHARRTVANRLGDARRRNGTADVRTSLSFCYAALVPTSERGSLVFREFRDTGESVVAIGLRAPAAGSPDNQRALTGTRDG